MALLTVLAADRVLCFETPALLAPALMGLKPIYQLPKFYEYAFRVIGDGDRLPVVSFLRCEAFEIPCCARRRNFDGRAEARGARSEPVNLCDRSFGSETRRSADQPVRPQEALTQRFLTAAAEGVSPIRSSDISPETWAPAAGANPSVGG